LVKVELVAGSYTVAVCASQTSSSTPQVVGALTTSSTASSETSSSDDWLVGEALSADSFHGDDWLVYSRDDWSVVVLLSDDSLPGDDWLDGDVVGSDWLVHVFLSSNSATLSVTGVQVLEDAGWVEGFDTL